MRIIKKLFIGILIIIGMLIIIVNMLVSFEIREESKFYDIKIPENLNFEKPIEFLSEKQIDSLKNLEISNEKILVVGSGYGGYHFYMWHKPVEKGEIYIKAFELTQNVQLSERELIDRTKNKIYKLSDSYEIYEGNTVIHEGTFEKYYPARFELWFKSEKSGFERKLTEKNYVIDGWNR